jgi:NADPH:quinone reductase-like Zn-dependent oxidoreductase
VRAFRKEVRKITDGKDMQIVCDMMRGSVFQPGLVACSREGVNVSAGWQLGQRISYDSALLSLRQITIDHTHYETIDGCAAATELYGSVFKPTVHHEIYRFEDLPRAMHEMYLNVQTGIPIIQVADELPESVKKLVP